MDNSKLTRKNVEFFIFIRISMLIFLELLSWTEIMGVDVDIDDDHLFLIFFYFGFFILC